MYAELASWFHLITAPEDYEEEAAFFTKMLRDACDRPPQPVRELGSGGGTHASPLKAPLAPTRRDPPSPTLRPATYPELVAGAP